MTPEEVRSCADTQNALCHAIVNSGVNAIPPNSSLGNFAWRHNPSIQRAVAREALAVLRLAAQDRTLLAALNNAAQVLQGAE